VYHDAVKLFHRRLFIALHQETRAPLMRISAQESFFFEMIAPLAPALPPLGAGAFVMPLNYL
jgi:hypothetical protein